jgi:GcrA cell cycle regulator
MAIDWNDELIAKLSDYWKEGFSSSQIASRLSVEFAIDISRSAVIGKLYRMGMTSDPVTTMIKNRQANRRTSARLGKRGGSTPKAAALAAKPATVTVFTRPNYGTAEPLPKEEKPSDYAKLYSVQELTEGMCRFPIGDPLQPDFGFCGKDKVPGKPYCISHCQRAYRPPEVRQRSPKPVVVPTFADLEKV